VPALKSAALKLVEGWIFLVAHEHGKRDTSSAFSTSGSLVMLASTRGRVAETGSRVTAHN
jgi:hypothetical protein